MVFTGVLLTILSIGLSYAKQIYPFDFVKKQPYKTIWEQNVWREVEDKKADVWLKGAEGVASPLETVTVGTQKYQRATVCEPHNCGDNIIYFLISSKKLVGIQFKRNDSGYLNVIRYGTRNRAEENYLINWYKRDTNY